MAQLRIYHNQALVLDFSLKGIKECRVGRDPSCDIHLDQDTGVSRSHLLLKLVDRSWIVECVAKSQMLFKEGKQVSSLRLAHEDRFSIPGYDFEFLSSSTQDSDQNLDQSLDQNSRRGLKSRSRLGLDSNLNTNSNTNSNTGSSSLSHSGSSSSLKKNLDYTQNSQVQKTQTDLGLLPSIPALIRYDEYGQVAQTITMNGSAWIIGQDSQNAIHIDHPKLSRKHFEILRKEGRFLIRDLESANGTFLNGKGLEQNQWMQLHSGDEISIFDLKLRFVLRDASFDSRLEEAQNFLSPFLSHNHGGGVMGSSSSPFLTEKENSENNFSEALHGEAQQSFEGAPFQGNSIDWESSIPEEEISSSLSTKKKTKYLRLVFLVVIILGFILHFLMEDSQQDLSSQSAEALSPFDKLSAEQKATVKQFYQSAQMFLQQGKYELARQEILKLHQIISFYEDSKQIEETANQGILMLQEKERLEAEAKEREIIQEKIKNQIVECRKILNPKIEMFEMELCLAPILEFDPAHPEILVLKNEVQKITEERAIKEAKHREYMEKVSKLKELYTEAENLDKNEDWLKAIASYEKVTSSELPDPNHLKGRSKNRSSEIQQMLVQRQAEVERAAEQAYQSGNLKEAIKIIREGIAINTENQIILGRHEEWMAELRRNMMPLYQDSILDESIGEVDSAKVKWQKINSSSLPGEDYFEKSKVKLKKYGVWK
jgi:pSer/pThr/pTyr-binding forkhead associated (FHA) protein